MATEYFNLTPEQEIAADRYVDQGRGSYDDWRRIEGVMPITEAAPRSASQLGEIALSDRAMTAPDAEEYRRDLEELGPEDPDTIK